jgi:hypothetical protein
MISNVQLTGQGTTESPFSTQFNYSNIDPQIGHGFPRPVGRWKRYFHTCNGLQLGEQPRFTETPIPGRGAIYILVGGNYSTISDKVTNLWLTLDISDYYPTFSAVTMFGRAIQLLNGRFTDPFGVTRSMLLVWHGKEDTGEGFWSVASQNKELTEINQYEENSAINAYGTDGTYLYMLFNHPDATLPKRLSTKSFRGPGEAGLTIKIWKRLFMEIRDLSAGRGAPSHGVSFNGQLRTRGGGLPNGSEEVNFEIPPGKRHDILAWPTAGQGIEAELDLLSYSEDFAIERIDGMLELRTLFGA